MPFDAPTWSNGDGELLMKAKLAIMRRGWVQGRYTDAGRLCAVAALAIACENQQFLHPSRTQRHLARLLAREAPHRGMGWLYRWTTYRWTTGYFQVKMYNDSPYTTYNDVMTMYDRAIQRQEDKVWGLLPAKRGSLI